MKIIILIIAVNCISFTTFSQIIPSSCNAHDTIIQKYYEDAQRLTFRRITSDSSIYMDSIQLPQTLIDSSLKAIIAVYNSTSLAVRDTIINQFDIHSYHHTLMNLIVLQVDTNYAWAARLHNGYIVTGDSIMDSIISKYGMTISFIYYPIGLIDMQTNANYNIEALIKILESIPGVISAETRPGSGDGPDITDTFKAEYTKTTFSFGWGDCPAGCIYRRFWTFKVFNDCSVELDTFYGPVHYYGNSIEKSNIDNKIIVFPNPIMSTSTFKINSTSKTKKITFYLYDIHGKLVRHTRTLLTTDKTFQFNRKKLISGIYYYRMIDQKSILGTGKIIID